MANNVKNLIISRDVITKRGGVVILSLDEYRRLCENVAPTYYLKGKAAKRLDKLVEEGLRDHYLRKTRKIKSLADLD